MLKEQTGVTQAGEAFGWASTINSTQGFHIAGCSYNAFVGIRQ